jgi:nucleotide-binding universal stress UspA family protein
MSDSGKSGSKKSGSRREKSQEKCVVCATDLSPAAQHALGTAAELAEALDAKLLIVHGMELWDKRYDFLVPDLQEKLTDEAEKKLAAELHHLGKTETVPIEVLIEQGPVVEKIIKVVVERAPLMLVIGSNSSPDPKETHIGGLAQELIRLSPVSVVVTRASTSPDIKRILCAIGGHAPSKDALQFALDLAACERVSEITVVHTFEVPTGYLEAGMTHETVREKMLNLHRADLEKLLASCPRKAVSVRTIIEEGPVAETVARVAGQERADLLVVGSESRSFLAALLLGRMGLRIASETNIPVALVKSKKPKLGLLAALGRV